MSKKYLLIFGVLSPLLGILLSALYASYLVFIWKYEGPSRTFSIKNGETFSHINYRLHEAKLISSAKLFHRYAQVTNQMTKFRTGKFGIPRKTNMVQMFDILIHSKPIASKVTIPEGKNIYEIANILVNEQIIGSKEKFIALAKDPKITKSLSIDAHTLEGYLYPDTYFFEESSDELTILKMMVANFRKHTENIYFEDSHLTPFQVLTLASIVEKETGAKSERPTIAGVFLNRLNKKMRLQSDPTTIYGIYEKYNGNLKKEHLQEKNHYNTYKIPALPIGPIASPGIDSIKAVIYPEHHQYLYFVSRNDGTHVFSKNYQDHNNAVNEWQKSRKNRSGKSWRNLQQ